MILSRLGRVKLLVLLLLLLLPLLQLMLWLLLPGSKIHIHSYIKVITGLEQILSLNGDAWLLSNSTMDGLSCKVPGGVYTALLNNSILGDPYFRNHDTEYFWVGRSDWTYSRNFTVDATLLNKQEIILVCNGLDTISRVYLNGRSVGKSDNMFVRYTFDIKNAIKKSADTPNEIMINFTSAVKYGEERAKALDKRIPPECPPSTFHGECHGNLVRKMQCAFSWDWGPAFVSQGIWQDIFIVAYDKLIITDVTTRTEKGQKSWKLHVKVFTRAARDVHVTGLVRAHVDGIDSQWEQAFTGTDLESIDIEGIFIPKDAVEMWWPRGYGPQRLYNLTVEILDGQRQILSTKVVKIGFRTVELVEEKLPGNSNGLTFFFKVNDQPIFLKGSNWVPADSFLERVSRDRLRNYMTSAADANMNCLRVWGGGIYETDYFYDLADELGILIWQDFMYACALYPTDDVFLSSVRLEVTYQVRRLKNHPSLLAYSGNNENELGLKGWWGVGNDQRYIDDYLTLYVATIKRLLEAEDPGRPFMLSSPSNGAETVKQGGISNFPASNLYGDIHDYNYGRRYWDASAYQVPRMASEYGLQSFPSPESLASVYDDADMRYGSELNANRQHHAGGNQEMLNLINMYLLPPSGTEERQKFSDLIYCTQIMHAVAMRTETEHYRRWQNQLTSNGEGHTMGALYWMFADIWQAPSWASIEYGGKWKMLHYFARKFFAPILISPYVDNSDLKVFLVVDELPTFDRNDPLEIELELRPVITEDERPFNMFALRSWWHEALELLKTEYRNGTAPLLSLLQGSIYMRVYAWESLEPRFTEEIPFRILKPSEQVFTASVESLVAKAKCGSAQNCFLFLHLGDPDTGPTSWLPLTTIKDAKGLEKPDLKITKVTTDPSGANTFIIYISTNRPAPFVWLEAPGVKGRFSDNGFLLCDRASSVRFYAWETLSDETLRKALTITSLMDIYR